MSKAKIELWALLFVLSGWKGPENASTTFWVIFGLAIALWLGYLFRKAHPRIFRDIQTDLPGTAKMPGAKDD
jgi:hypothetical protein